jgi:hypothetical protein
LFIVKVFPFPLESAVDTLPVPSIKCQAPIIFVASEVEVDGKTSDPCQKIPKPELYKSPISSVVKALFHKLTSLKYPFKQFGAVNLPPKATAIGSIGQPTTVHHHHLAKQ